MKNITQKKSLCIFMWSLSIALPQLVQAQSNGCDAILSKGIRDVSSSANAYMQYDVAYNALCSARTYSNSSDMGFIFNNLELDTESTKSVSSKFCSSSFEESQLNSTSKTFIRKINQSVVSAWSKCMANNKPSGLSHYFSVVDDETFIYGMEYTSTGEGDPLTKIIDWDIDGNTSCNNSVPKEISTSGFEMICHRQKEKSVVVTAKATFGSKYLKAIVLPGIKRKIPLPPYFPRSCNEIDKNKGDGVYTIDPDGKDYGAAPLKVYCDMTTSGGGWTLFAHHSDGINPKYVQTVSPNSGSYGVVNSKVWNILRKNMKDGMMFKDEAGRISTISKAKLESANCVNINATTPGIDHSLIHSENSGCSTRGQDYTLIHLTGSSYVNYSEAGAALYQQSSLKFDIWPYTGSYSHNQQKTLKYFLR